MRKARLKARPQVASETVDRFAAAHSSYKETSVYLPQSEDNDNAGWYKVSRNEDINLMECWVTQDAGYTGDHLRKAYRCRDLWDCMPRPTNSFKGHKDNHEGRRHAYAAQKLFEFKRSVDRRDWEAFENAMRWNEPGGYIGSRLLSPMPHVVEATKAAVRRILEELPR